MKTHRGKLIAADRMARTITVEPDMWPAALVIGQQATLVTGLATVLDPLVALDIKTYLRAARSVLGLSELPHFDACLSALDAAIEGGRL